MSMTTKEKMEALTAGETLYDVEAGTMYLNEGGCLSWQWSEDAPQRIKKMDLGSAFLLVDWQIKPKPTMRPMTRDEVLGFILNTQGIVVRFNGGDWVPGPFLGYSDIVGRYEWTTVSLDGIYGEPRKFEKEVGK